MTTGERIRAARKKKNWTQKKLGDECGMADSAIRRYESGRGNPTLSTLQRIADALDVSVAYLQGFESMEARAIVDAIKRKDARELERLMGLDEGFIADMNPELREGESIISTLAHDENEANAKMKLLTAFSQLNPEGQQRAVERVEELTEIPKYKK